MRSSRLLLLLVLAGMPAAWAQSPVPPSLAPPSLAPPSLGPSSLVAQGPAPEAAPSAPPAGQGPIQGGRRQPAPRAEIEQRQRAAGIAVPEENETRELQDLNALSRQLAPPGTPVPAPEVPPRR